MSRRTPGLVARLWTALVVLFLYLPIAATVLTSFNASRLGLLPFDPSWQWYAGLSADSPLVVSTVTSVELAVWVTLTCAVLGTGLALWLARRGLPRFKVATNGVLLVTVAVPVLILSVGILAVVNAIGLGQSALALWLACSVTSLPYMVFVVTARLQSLDPALVSASRSLGAGPVATFRRVTLPMVRSAILAGALMAFVICFNNFTVQLLIAPLGVQTLPVEIYTQTRVGLSPDINAVASLIVGVTVVVVVLLQLATGSAARVLGGLGKETSDG